MNNKRDYQKEWEDFWKDICTDDNGNLNLDQVKRELSDYSFILEQLPTIYCHITGDTLSKPFYDAKTIINLADEHYQNHYYEIISDDLLEIINDNELDDSEKLTLIKKYVEGIQV